MEWQVLEGSSSHVQKVLNQWRHQYHIHIHGYNAYDAEDGSTWNIILLTREKKK